jgi:DNA helicase-2/ATP-dependent DNA helicase PcrA
MQWNDALDELEGTNAVPIMTIHKSKGLEYHTVVFVGFEDSAFWNFHKKPTEETCTFFCRVLARQKPRRLHILRTSSQTGRRTPRATTPRRYRAALCHFGAGGRRH